MGPQYYIALSADGKRGAIGDQESFRLFDPLTGKVQNESAKGNKLVFAGNDKWLLASHKMAT